MWVIKECNNNKLSKIARSGETEGFIGGKTTQNEWEQEAGEQPENELVFFKSSVFNRKEVAQPLHLFLP